MAVQRKAHGLHERRLPFQKERIAQHEIAELAGRAGQQQVAHGDDADEPARHVRDVDIGKKIFCRQFAHDLDGLDRRLVRPENRQGRLGQLPDGEGRILFLAAGACTCIALD